VRRQKSVEAKSLASLRPFGLLRRQNGYENVNYLLYELQKEWEAPIRNLLNLPNMPTKKGKEVEGEARGQARKEGGGGEKRESAAGQEKTPRKRAKISSPVEGGTSRQSTRRPKASKGFSHAGPSELLTYRLQFGDTATEKISSNMVRTTKRTSRIGGAALRNSSLDSHLIS